MAELLTKASYSKKMNEREKQNLLIAYRAACEGIVLLENDGTLPLKNKEIALFGAGASRTIKGGSGSGEVNERHSITIFEGLEKAGFDVETESWIADYERAYIEGKEQFEKDKRNNILKHPSNLMKIMEEYQGPEGRKITKKDIEKNGTDTCIYVLSRQAGEGVDRRTEKGDWYLTDIEKENIKNCAKYYDKFVLILNSGGQIGMEFTEEMEGINAILYIGQLGTAGGMAVADVLRGKVNPSGKLTDTWAKKYADIPFSDEFSYLNGNLDDEYYKEGIYVGYRYFDTFNVEPKYPFGYGMSYTDFKIEPLSTEADGKMVTVTVKVTNTGDTFAGKEVVQIYVTAPAGIIAKEYQRLVGFGKTKKLEPGESGELKITFDMASVASYREKDACYVLEGGRYIARIGNSSRNTVPAATITLGEKVILSQNEKVCPLNQPLAELKAPERKIEEIPENLPNIFIKGYAFDTQVYFYDTPEICDDPKVQKFLDDLSLEEMVEIIVGIGMFGGETKFTMPGSVGNTTSKFWEKGLANITLCDGPAGIRIQKRSGLMKDGTVKMIDAPMSAFNMIPGFAKKFVLADPRKSTVLYQFTTAFPVATVLAQTWNTDLLYKVGLAIHAEMKEYGCTYWLAPALNIHRNPLCGRNFEYYSEDPLLTGKVAAAITKGIQSEDGYYVTIKHFAANNQEDNRKGVSSNLSERALREIYLTGFEIAVREGGAKGVMTSYNKINGVYTPNNYDLCTKVLRNEWGFEGVVMTDWFSTSKGSGDTALCMAAGNDLIMPGGNGFKKEILKGVKKGKITEEDVRRCCANVVKAILESAIQKEYIDKK